MGASVYFAVGHGGGGELVLWEKDDGKGTIADAQKGEHTVLATAGKAIFLLFLLFF